MKTSVICAIVKNEQRFIREWAEHYLRIGFDRLYIYEDFGSASHFEELKDLIEDGRVVLTPLATANIIPHYKKGTHVQRCLYDYFLWKCKKEKLADWAGFFDVDEFLMFEDGWDLTRLENYFSDKGGVLLSWKVYGANGHMKRPKGNVVDNYTKHLPEGSLIGKGRIPEWNVKSLVNVRLVGNQRAIHVFDGCVFTDGKSFTNGNLVFCKAWLNHYYAKSWEDYCDRIFARGNMHNNYRCLDLFFEVSPEFSKSKKAMIYAQRQRHCASTMWLSRDLKLISGGNERRIEELTKKYVQNAH